MGNALFLHNNYGGHDKDEENRLEILNASSSSLHPPSCCRKCRADRKTMVQNILAGRATSSSRSCKDPSHHRWNTHRLTLTTHWFSDFDYGGGSQVARGLQLHLAPGSGGIQQLRELVLVPPKSERYRHNNRDMDRFHPHALQYFLSGLSCEGLEYLQNGLTHAHMLQTLKLQIRSTGFESTSDTYRLLAQVIQQQPQLQVLDLSGSYIALSVKRENDNDERMERPSLVNALKKTAHPFVDAVARHPCLHTLLVRRTNAGVELLVPLLDTLCQETTTTTTCTKLRHVDLSSCLMSNSLALWSYYRCHYSHESLVYLFQCLPDLPETLETIVLDFLVLQTRPEKGKGYSPPPSLLFQIQHVLFLDRLYQRLALLEQHEPQTQRLPRTLMPLLGHVPEGYHGHFSAPYVSNALRVQNQMLLGGLNAMIRKSSDDTNGGGCPTNNEKKWTKSRLLPDWKQGWYQPHKGVVCDACLRRSSRRRSASRRQSFRCTCRRRQRQQMGGSSLLEYWWTLCCLEASVSSLEQQQQWRQTQGVFCETALFQLLIEHPW